MGLLILVADDPERRHAICRCIEELGHEASVFDARGEAKGARYDVVFAGARYLNDETFRGRFSPQRRRPAVVGLDSTPAVGENLCLDLAVRGEEKSILAAALERHSRLIHARRHMALVAGRSAELYAVSHKLREVNGRVHLAAESTRRLFSYNEEERVLNEILQMVARHTGGCPAVLLMGRKDSLAPRMGLAVLAERLTRQPIVVAPAAWQGVKPFEGFLGERELDTAMIELFGVDKYYLLPLGPRGRAQALIAVAGDPAAANRAAVRDYLPFAYLALRNVRRMRNLRALADRDSLTGLLNHGAIQRILRLEIKRHGRSGAKFGLAMLDVDHFKSINDQHGHPAGDRALKLLAELLLKFSRETDSVARYGGEEFVLLLADTDRAGAETKIAELLTKVREHGFGGLGPITMSAGIASYPTDGETGAELVLAADQALYAAKNGGRDRAMTYAEWLEETLAEEHRGSDGTYG